MARSVTAPKLELDAGPLGVVLAGLQRLFVLFPRRRIGDRRGTYARGIDHSVRRRGNKADLWHCLGIPLRIDGLSSAGKKTNQRESSRFCAASSRPHALRCRLYLVFQGLLQRLRLLLFLIGLLRYLLVRKVHSALFMLRWSRSSDARHPDPALPQQPKRKRAFLYRVSKCTGRGGHRGRSGSPSLT